MDIPELGFPFRLENLEHSKIKKNESKKIPRLRHRKLLKQTMSLIKNMNCENELEIVKQALLKLISVLSKHKNDLNFFFHHP